MAGRPVPREQLPTGVECVLARGPLTAGDRQAITDFKAYLGRRRDIERDYDEQLAAIAPSSPEYRALWNARTNAVHQLTAEYGYYDFAREVRPDGPAR